MPKRIPISSAKDIAAKHSLRQVILVAWDGERTHVVTYGVNEEECSQAAEGGNRVKAAIGWPEYLCNEEPSRVKKLKARIFELESALKESESAYAAFVESMSDSDPSEEVKILEARNQALEGNAMTYRLTIGDLESSLRELQLDYDYLKERA